MDEFFPVGHAVGKFVWGDGEEFGGFGGASVGSDGVGKGFVLAGVFVFAADSLH